MKCKECGQPLDGTLKFVLWNSRYARMNCSNCDEEYKTNIAAYIGALVIGNMISFVLILLLPGLYFPIVSLVMTLISLSILANICGVEQVKRVAATNLSIGTSPILILVPLFAVIFYFMFS